MTYIDHRPEPRYVRGRAPNFDVSHSWQEFTEARLRWLYGERHMMERRATTAADLVAWNNLGRGKIAA